MTENDKVKKLGEGNARRASLDSLFEFFFGGARRYVRLGVNAAALHRKYHLMGIIRLSCRRT